MSKQCRLSDHGLDFLPIHKASETEVKQIFKRRLAGSVLDENSVLQYKAHLLHFLCEQYQKHGWVQQFHIGPLRNVNSRMYAKLGANTGFDTIGEYEQAKIWLFFLMNWIEKRPGQNHYLQCKPTPKRCFCSHDWHFTEEGIRAKMQFGSGWWFLDQLDGMQQQINILSQIGLISQFVGMLTDSRSFLSFPRHEYFRRLLCNIFGNENAKRAFAK